MKRSSPDERDSVTTFFLMRECVDMLLVVCSPRLVCQLIQLNEALRRAVWRVLADPVKCDADWFNLFLERLWELVDCRLIPADQPFGGVAWACFNAPCWHTAQGRFYLGKVSMACYLGGEVDDLSEMSGDELANQCSAVVAYVTSRESVDRAHWQPVCCSQIRHFNWWYVAKALAENVDSRVVLHNNRDHSLSHERDWRHLYIH